MPSLQVIRYCAEEVSRQRDDPIAVFWMLDAWDYALTYGELPISLAAIQIIAHLTKPVFGYPGTTRTVANETGKWRYQNVRVGSRICPPPQELPELMGKWMANLTIGMTPEEAYKEFELIHPFVDGNGRVGKVIYNWLKGTLDDPQMPPNFFGGSNP